VTGMGKTDYFKWEFTNIIDSPKHNKDRFTLDYVLGHDFISFKKRSFFMKINLLSVLCALMSTHTTLAINTHKPNIIPS